MDTIICDTCAICGDLLSDKINHKLDCEHVFHYECLLKSFGNHNAGKNRNCPYCRKQCSYLPLVNGLKKISIGIHCPLSGKEAKTEEFKKYNSKCNHILKRGKNKGQECGKNCKLGYYVCNAHLKT